MLENKRAETLRLLRESGKNVSGQELCEHFGISRTAVWKMMNQLKEEGYEIEAVQNKGYRLLNEPDLVTKDELESRVIYKSARDQRFYLMQEIKREGAIAPKPNNNWRFVPEQWVKPAAQRDRAILFGK